MRQTKAKTTRSKRADAGALSVMSRQCRKHATQRDEMNNLRSIGASGNVIGRLLADESGNVVATMSRRVRRQISLIIARREARTEVRHA